MKKLNAAEFVEKVGKVKGIFQELRKIASQCPCCPPNGPCSACLSEGVAKKGPGRPRLKDEDKRVKISLQVHPSFPVHLAKLAFDADLPMGRYIEKLTGFTPKPK